MSATYGLINLITSFGFSARWRRQCVAELAFTPGETVVDLMSGMGELWPGIAARHREGRIIGIDFSSAMCERSKLTADRLTGRGIEILERDALDSGLADESVDAVVSSFGLKTFSADQRADLAREIARMLRPGGRFSMLEISVPPSRLLHMPYMFYLRRVIPLLGRLLMGNPDNYRMLGVYTTAFGDCADFAIACKNAGLEVRQTRYFFGCATGVVGTKKMKI
jgi:demethylmenaquinone methyltransferase/2-methoxy-6-polyprenyl-1,4-benzoquinol methylase